MVRPVSGSFARRRRLFALAIVLSVLLAGLHTLPSRGQTQAPSYRTITGVITDDGHEPLHDAVVELENTANHQIVSYVTAADGRYIFKRLDSHTDFQLWATFRGHKSAVRSISMFDSHLEKVIDIVCKTY